MKVLLFFVLALLLRAADFQKKSKRDKISWIDNNSPDDALTATSFLSKEEFELVFSDEFEEAGRTFKDGHDPKWTALDKDDGLSPPSTLFRIDRCLV